jgi:UDP-N-acetylmuramoyl-tripeptide--D-alanyl-D-alanine ligase
MMQAVVAAAALRGRLIGPDVTFMRVTTDSRALAPGDLFVALQGERFDGHDFVVDALSRGAVAALVKAERVHVAEGTLIAVDDTLAALGKLAAHWRRRFDIPVVVVVGSNGKTTVKEMIAAVLRAQHGDDHVLATRGNLNNAIGLPLTLLALRDEHKAAVIELGMNHPGETAELAPIAAPTVGVINNAQREHQEFMRSVADVAAEHAALLRSLSPGGTGVINADDPNVQVWRDALPPGCACLEFGLDQRADVRGQSVPTGIGLHLDVVTPAGVAQLKLAASGRHNASNALAATAAGLAANVPFKAIVQGLQAFRPVAGRLVSMRATSGAHVIDDSYNANPDSVHAAIAVLAAAPAPRWLVLGDMGEVGAEGPAFHREAGEAAREAGIERVLTVGTLAAETSAAFGAGGEHFASVEALADHLAAHAGADVTLLVKGSRFMRMERVVARLTGTQAGGAH